MSKSSHTIRSFLPRVGGVVVGVGVMLALIAPGVASASFTRLFLHSIALPALTGSHATGDGELTAGSREVTDVSTSRGAFAVGQEIAGLDIPPATAITAVGDGTLQLSAPASAANTNVQLTATGPFSVEGLPSGVAVNAADDLLVGVRHSPIEGDLDEFSPAYKVEAGEEPSHLLNALTPEGSEPAAEELDTADLAVGFATGEIFLQSPFGYIEGVTGTGQFTGRLGRFMDPHVAVDNSCSLQKPALTGVSCEKFDPSYGSVYVSHDEPNSSPGDGKPRGIERLSATGTPIDFSEAGNLSYVSGNQITGTPSESFEYRNKNRPQSIAVDSHGDIYVANPGIGAGIRQQVDEYEPSGRFVQNFTGAETPGLGGSREEEGWGGGIGGLAIDPVSGHLIVAVEADGPDEGVLDEFDPSTGRFVSQIAQTTAGHPLSRGLRELAVDSRGDLYLADEEEDVVYVWGPGAFDPSVKLTAPSQRMTTSVVLNGAVNPEGQSLSGCVFQYVSETAFDKEGAEAFKNANTDECQPSAGEIAKELNLNTSYAVHAEVPIVSGTTYEYRLVATSAGELGGTTESDPLPFTAPDVPRVDSVAAGDLSSTFAELKAQIDPLGADSSYHFEYSANGASWVSEPASGEDIGTGGFTGSATANVAQQIGGLTPATTYRFRAVAENSVGTSQETEQSTGTFTTLATVAYGLPDDRAYELVTPPDKGSATDMFAERTAEPNEFRNSDTGYASESGDGFLLTSTLAAFGPLPGAYHNAYLFSRSESGWQARSLAAPSLGVQSIVGDVFDPADLSEVGINDFVGSLASPEGTRVENLLGSAGGPYATLNADAPGAGGEQTELVGGSRELSEVVLESKSHTLAPGAEKQDEGSTTLYEHSAGGLALVNVNSEGALLNRCGAELGQSHNAGTRHDAVSSDGAQIVFTAPDPYAKDGGVGCWKEEEAAGGKISQVNPPELYARSGGTTTEISAPERGISDPTCPRVEVTCYPALYAGAAEDGSRVFFVTEAELTKSDEGIHDPELYEYDTQTGRLLRISAGEAGTAGASGGAEVDAVPAISSDGAAVYFMASGQLTHDAPPVTGGDVDLYRYDTATATTAYVATVEKRDYPAGGSSGWEEHIGDGTIALNPSESWYTTPDGDYLIFASHADLGGYSTVEASPGDCPAAFLSGEGRGDGHCTEVYRYHYEPGAQAGAGVVCLSCDPSGAPPVSNAEFAANAGSETDPAGGPVRAISNDGAYAFFATADALVPQDTNGTLDVYEWHDGRLSLISSGADPAPSFFLGMSADGSNVFFGSHARLVPQDTDDAGDIYDARICEPESGNPCIQPPLGETAQCEGGACQTPPPSASDPTPALLPFSGLGGLAGEAPAKTIKKKAPAVCRRHFTRRKGKCVKVHKPRGRAKKVARSNRGGAS
ncbi:MAG TPA: hypothetical protein VK756_00265 [Solirubrobacteraceae bacterium]|jgi:hypothetical protein|nr:hypothetical protein [Solirubrobacteraceae bacterium]